MQRSGAVLRDRSTINLRQFLTVLDPGDEVDHLHQTRKASMLRRKEKAKLSPQTEMAMMLVLQMRRTWLA